MSDKKTGLDLLREPFPPHQIGKLAKETSAQKDERTPPPRGKGEIKNGMKCQLCGGWHHRNAIHLDYVGHAALTDRLLDADPNWTWEPLAFKDGLPQFDASGGLWIKLTVCGMTRLGYGNAPESEYKDIGSREKEVIGDALRNAAMRFGAALELWHKGILHVDEETGEVGKQQITASVGAKDRVTNGQLQQIDALAIVVLDAFAAGNPDLAYAKYVDAQTSLKAYGADAQVAFRDKFDSKQRATLQKYAEADREKKMAAMYGQQA